VTGDAEILGMLDFRDGDEEWNARRRIAHQGTFNAQPVSAAAGLATLRLLARGGEIERADAAATRLVRGLNALFRERAVPGSAWCVSSMWHLNLGYDAPMPPDLE